MTPAEPSRVIWPIIQGPTVAVGGTAERIPSDSDLWLVIRSDGRWYPVCPEWVPGRSIADLASLPDGIKLPATRTVNRVSQPGRAVARAARCGRMGRNGRVAGGPAGSVLLGTVFRRILWVWFFRG